MALDRNTAAKALREIAGLLEVHASNPHRVRAFANASRAVERIEGDLDEMIDDGSVLQIKGIGRSTAGVLADLAAGRRPDVLVELDEKTPSGVLELLEVAGLGPKKVGALWRGLGITSAGELEYACRENRLVDLPGFGPASQTTLLESVRFHLASRERTLVHQAWAVADRLIARIAAQAGAVEAVIAGELRRGCETVGQIDVVMVGGAEVGDLIEQLIQNAVRVGSDRWQGATEDKFPIEVWRASPDRAAAMLAWATGTGAHLAALDMRAREMGLSFDQRGLRSGENLLNLEREEDLFEALGCEWIPPELRQDGSEVDAAAAGSLPHLVEPGDLLGALHNHTTDSDGTASVAAMAAAAGRLGWRFLGIGDHSPAAHYANGLSADRLQRQWETIDRLNEQRNGPRVVKGLEADILPDGRLDIPDGCESGLEYVVASVHTSFRLTEADQTERIIAALRHPACRVLGHPTGRLLLARKGYEVDLERVLVAAAEEGVAVEINASPYRLDLDHVWARRAIELGIQLAINPDAHSVEGLEDLRWGVTVARRAGATSSDVLNCHPPDTWLDVG